MSYYICTVFECSQLEFIAQLICNGTAMLESQNLLIPPSPSANDDAHLIIEIDSTFLRQAEGGWLISLHF